jgi:O-acetyl-ADP-ribose deacetylase (regulator of RNase III)
MDKKMKFIIKYGNLVEENATFIVNASNTELTLGSGVSHAFSEQCGGALYQEELYALKKKFGVIEQGDVILSTSGSATNFKYALHVAVMNYSDDSKPPYPSYMQIQNALKMLLNIVEERVKDENIQNPKFVIPLLGCGVGGLQKEKVFMMIKSAFQKSKLDLEVVIYFHNKQDFYLFSQKEL